MRPQPHCSEPPSSCGLRLWWYRRGSQAKAREAAMLPSDSGKVVAGTGWDGRMPVSCHDPLPVGHGNPGLWVALEPSNHNIFPVSLQCIS